MTNDPTFEWTGIHTAIGTLGKFCAFLMFKLPFPYVAYFADGMGVSIQDFTYGILAGELGGTLAVLFGSTFDGWATNNLQLFWFIVGAIASICMGIPHIVTLVTLIIYRGIYGFAFSLTVSNISGMYCICCNFHYTLHLSKKTK